MDPIIKIENLRYSYPVGESKESYLALDGVTMEIERGSFVAIIGRNGSGKSTLAKCLNALLLPDEGRVFVEGLDTKDEENTWNIRQTVGMVFQNPDNQIVSSIVEDDIAFGPENIGVPPEEIRKRVDDSLEAVGLAGFQRRAPHLLSGGQKQRVAIASAMAMRPKCIVFDEPTAMLDPKGRDEVMKIIRELNDEGITCILITHSMTEASKADRVIALEKGKVFADDTPKGIFTNKETVDSLDLDLPLVVDVSYRLRDEGFDVNLGIIEEEEFISEICRLK